MVQDSLHQAYESSGTVFLVVSWRTIADCWKTFGDLNLISGLKLVVPKYPIRGRELQAVCSYSSCVTRLSICLQDFYRHQCRAVDDDFT